MSKQQKNGICVAIPTSGRPVCIEWAIAMAQLSFPVGMNHSWGVSKADPAKGFTRDQQREALAEYAGKINAEFTLWIDDDTVPPPTAAQELFFVMAQNPNAGIVGGIYCTKEEIPSPIVFMELGAGPHWQWTLGDIFKCAGLGTGCMMVRNSILKDIPKPWFKDTSEAQLGEVEQHGDVELKIAGRSGTDDIFFCKKVAEAGYDIIAHGGILPVHYDYETGIGYKIPQNSYPVISYQEKLNALNATLPADQQRILLPPASKVVR